MATRFWRPATTGDWTSTASWSATSTGATGAAAPVNSDIVYLDGTTISVTANHTGLSGITLDELHIVGPGESGSSGGQLGFSGAVGASGSILNIASAMVKITKPIGRVFYGGTVSGLLAVSGTSSAKDAVTLSGSMANVEMSSGNLTIAAGATMPTGGDWKFMGGRSYVGDCTMPSSGNAGTVTVGEGAWVELLAMPTGTGSSVKVTGHGAFCQAVCNDTCPAITVASGATFRYNGAATQTRINLEPGGTLDLSGLTYNVTISTLQHWEKATIIWPKNAVTITISAEEKRGSGARGLGGSLATVTGFTGLGGLGALDG